MGRKRRDYEVTTVSFVIPLHIKEQLREAGVNMTQLFLDAAAKELQNRKKI
ncbi:MAG: hypothetical protein RR557_07075 [Bacilli bacterium]